MLKAQTPTCLNKTFHMIYSVIYSLGHLNWVSPVSVAVCIDYFQNNLEIKHEFQEYLMKSLAEFDQHYLKYFPKDKQFKMIHLSLKWARHFWAPRA